MNWYYADEQTPKGPFNEEDFQQLFQRGIVQADTLVWHEGLPEWKPYASFSPSVMPPAEMAAAPSAAQAENAVRPEDMEFAGFWIRFCATFVDGLILIVPFYAFSFSFSWASIFSGAETPIMLQLGLNLIQLVVGACYEIVMVSKYGATLGKMAVGVRVVRSDGAPLAYGRATGRYFAKILSEMILFIGYIMAGFDSEKRGLHDMICDTRVIKRR